MNWIALSDALSFNAGRNDNKRITKCRCLHRNNIKTVLEMKKARKQNTQKKKPHWPIMGFIKEKINSWYLMHPAPNLNGCSLVFLFPFKNTEYLNCGIDAFVLPSATLREVAERCLLEEVCISHLDRKLLFPAQHPTGSTSYPLRRRNLLCPDISSRSPFHFHFLPRQASHTYFYSVP